MRIKGSLGAEIGAERDILSCYIRSVFLHDSALAVYYA